MKKSFMALEEKIFELENKYSDLTISDSEDINGDSHFQLHNNAMEPHKGFQIFQTDSNNRDQTQEWLWYYKRRLKSALIKYYLKRSTLIPYI